MKHIEDDFSLKAWIQSPVWTKGLGMRPKINFEEYVHVAYQMKGKVVYNNMLANILQIYT